MNLFLRFLITGGTGALLSLITTWVLVEFLVGQEHYISAYMVGIGVNLLFNFIAYTLAVFKTKRDHVRRLVIFLFYGIIMAFFQSSTVQLITGYVGTSHYLIVIASVIGLFAVFNFFVFKLSLFREREDSKRQGPRGTLIFIIICATLLRVAISFHVLANAGVEPLIYGDAVSYIELAQNIETGQGFVSARTSGILQDEVFRTPGLPLLLAPFSATNTHLAFYFVLLAVLGGILLPFFTYEIAVYLVPPGTALIAAALVAFEPHLIFFSTLPQTEMPFMLTAYGALLIAFISQKKHTLLYAVFSGVLFGYAVLIRPGFEPVLLLALVAVIAYFLMKHRPIKILLFIVLGVSLALAPWYIRTHSITDTYSLSGAGWRNVYTDYLASVRAIEHHTDFSSEKHNLKQQAEEAGVPTDQVDNPAYGKKLRDYSLKELWQHRNIVLKLEPILILSFFTQDGYYYQFERFLLIPPDDGSPHISPTFVLLHKGLGGMPEVLRELSRQLFIPIVGRAFTIGAFLLALWGFFLMENRFRFVLLLVLALSALTATAIGLGVEARLRLPVEPILYLFVALAIAHVLTKRRHHHEA